MLEAEGATPSIVRDHAFEPRWLPTNDDPRGVIDARTLAPNLYLCQRCRLAEAAHEETTVER